MVNLKYTGLLTVCLSCVLISSTNSILASPQTESDIIHDHQSIVAYSSNLNTVVSIPDQALKAALNAQLGQSPNSDITREQLRNLNGILYLDHKGISDLTGLQECINLEGLDLSYNNIVDLSPLTDLTKLTNLYLEYNQIQDITPLSNLTHLVELHLSHNRINKISNLKSLVNLTMLHLADNQITSLVGLSPLKKLTELTLSMNHIYDLSPLSSLTNLVTLTLDQNQIKDISPLSSLINLNALDLSKNQVEDISPLSVLTRLTILYLDDNQIKDITAINYLLSLTQLGLSNNRIQNIRPLHGLPQLSTLYLMNQKIKLDPLNVFPGENATLRNPIQDIDKTDIEPKTISNNGYYDPSNYLITWLHVNQPQTESFTFERTVSLGNATSTFSGEVLVPLAFNGNSSPVLLIDDPLILQLNQVFDPSDYVTAYDAEDGDITEWIILKENTIDITQIGTYRLTFEVTDSDGMTVSKSVEVHVTPRIAPRTGVEPILIPLGMLSLGVGIYLKRRQK